MNTRVIVTRPAREAARWADLLRARGIDALALPLIDIQPVQDPVLARRLIAMRASMERFAALMFVSANAVSGFLDGVAVPPGLPCWATGPGTRAALVAAGVPEEQIVAPDAAARQFDSEALWALVRGSDWHGRRVLIVRGASQGPQDGLDEPAGQGRDWLAGQLTQAGAQVEFVVSYRRAAALPTGAQMDALRMFVRDRAIWLFSSSESLAHLPAGLDLTQARAVATHERVAQAARGRGFVTRVCKPSIDEVVRSIESFNA